MNEAEKLIEAYVTAVLKYDLTNEEKDFEAAETLWLEMVDFAQKVS